MPRENLWVLEDIRLGLEKYKNENGKYPSATEFEACAYLPTARQMQRRFGGMVELRKLLDLEGPSDFSKGEHSSQRAKMIGVRAHIKEKEVYDFLVQNFEKPFVHREFLFDDSRMVRTDFYVYTKDGGFAVDVFYPKDRHNLVGCLNSKIRTYRADLKIEYPIIFLMMNESIEKEELKNIILKRKNKLLKQQMLMNMEEFRYFCSLQNAFVAS